MIIAEYECKFHRNLKVKRYLISIFVLSKRFPVSDNSPYDERKYTCVVKKSCIFQILIQSNSSFPSYVTFFVEYPLTHRGLKNKRGGGGGSKQFFKKASPNIISTASDSARKCTASCRSSSGELLQKTAEARLL